MRRSSWIALLVVAALVITTIISWPRVERGLLALHGIEIAPASAKTTKARANSEGWPDTRAGVMAQKWVAAYDSGEVAMRRFYESSMSRESLAKKSAEARLDGYRKLRDRVGKLMLASVVESEDTELTVSLLADDGVPREFIFALETRPPYYLLTVTMREIQHRGGHGGGHP